jgi:ribosomal protein S18 acetylase RimI-like enzyme
MKELSTEIEFDATPKPVNSVEIRAFRPEDTEAVVALWEACDLVRPWNDPRRDIERKTRMNSDLFIVAVDGDGLIGSVMAGYEGHRGWINYLAVDPGRRREGLGNRLMAEAERLLEAAGCPKINLQVRSENADVIAFYRARGYEVDDVVSLGKRLVEDRADGR